MVVAPLNVLRPTSPDENEVEAYVPPTRPTHAGAANIARADSVVWRRSVADAKERAAVRVSLMVTEPIIEAVGPETQGGSAGKRGSVFGGGRGRRFSLVGGAV